MEERTYKALRQEVKNDLMQMYPGAVLLTAKQVAVLYGYSSVDRAKAALELPRVTQNHRVMYYLGDVASDIARRRLGNV